MTDTLFGDRNDGQLMFDDLAEVDSAPAIQLAGHCPI